MAVGTLQALYNRITLELGGRSDLITAGVGGALPTGPIPDAVNDAILAYQKKRFRFNELKPITPFNLNTVTNQYSYGVADDARIPQLMRIDYINYLLGSTNNKMERVTPEEIYLALVNGTSAGPPGSWAWDGDSIIIYPQPNQAYQLTIGGFLVYPAPTSLTDTTSPWCNAAERLIRSRAKYEIAKHVTRNEQMAVAMSPDTPAQNGGKVGASYAYESELLAEVNSIRGRSKVRPMQW